MAFAPIERPETAVDACEAAIRRSILDGELAPGTRLPPERELARRFAVNRVTVRSALGRLAAARLLSVRQGSGYVVRDFARTGGPDLLPGLAELARRRGDLREVASDLLLVRRQLARAVLERLARDRDEAALERMTAAVDRLEEVMEGGAEPEAIARADLDVVGAVVDATGSAVLRLCLNPVVTVLGELPELRDALYAEPAQNVLAWRALIATLRSGDPNALGPALDAVEARDEETVARLPRRRRRTT